MKTINPERSRIIDWRIVICAGLATVATRIIANYLLPQFDDSFIILRHAKNLATGNGFVFNEGSVVLGVSCPLFGLLEALFFWLHFPMPLTILVLNISLDIVVLVWGLRMLARHGRNISAIIFGIVFALSPALARISIGDMEMNLFLTLSLFSISLFHAGKAYRAIALASISFFIREEALILVILLITLTFFQGSKMSSLRLSALSLLCVIPGFVIMYYYYGSVIPQSVLIKLAWQSPSFFSPLHDLLLNDPIGVALLPFTFIGAWLAIRERGQLQTLVLWTISLLVIYCVKRSVTTPWYGESTHFAQFVLASLGLGSLLRRLPKVSRWFDGNRAIYVGALTTIAIWSFVAWKVGPSRVRTNIYGPLEKWGKSIPHHSVSIMASDIGAVGYYSDATIFDLDGLVWPSELRKDPERVVQELKPNFLFLIRSKASYDLSQTPTVSSMYALSMTLTQDSDKTPFEHAPVSWSQNYVVFERKDK